MSWNRARTKKHLVHLPKTPAERHPLLQILAEAFERTRKKRLHPFPIDPATGAINLPSDIVHELFHQVIDGNKIEAVKRVTELTGAGLRQAKDYVDHLTLRR